jgi:hypothetical protein
LLISLYLSNWWPKNLVFRQKMIIISKQLVEF